MISVVTWDYGVDRHASTYIEQYVSYQPFLSHRALICRIEGYFIIGSVPFQLRTSAEPICLLGFMFFSSSPALVYSFFTQYALYNLLHSDRGT